MQQIGRITGRSIKEVNKFTIQQHKQKQQMSEASAIVAEELLVNQVTSSQEQQLVSKASRATVLHIQEKDILRVLMTRVTMMEDGTGVIGYKKSDGRVTFHNPVHQKVIDAFFRRTKRN